MDKLIVFFRQPYPVVHKPWLGSAITSLIVFFILAFLEPFGISSIKVYKIPILLGYMVVTFSCMSFQYFLIPKIASGYYAEERWTVGKQVFDTMLTLLLITLGNIVYSSFFQGISLCTSLAALFQTLLIGVFPITLFTILRQNVLLAMRLDKVRQMSAHLNHASSLHEPIHEQTVVFGAGREQLAIDINDLIAVEASANYVKISYNQQGQVRQKLLRATMKQVEECTSSFPFVQKCHRAFLVNIRAVVGVKGNSQGYRLVMAGLSEEMPVSRAFSKAIKGIIESLPVN